MSESYQQARARAANEQAITEMCVLAGRPALAAGFIASGKDRLAVLADLRGEPGPVLTARQDGPTDPLASMRREIARAGLTGKA